MPTIIRLNKLIISIKNIDTKNGQTFKDLTVFIFNDTSRRKYDFHRDDGDGGARVDARVRD